MPAQNHGIETFTYGVPTLTGYVVQSFTRSITAANVTEVFDEVGNRIASRHDDATQELTLEAIIKAGTSLPGPGTLLTYSTVAYVVDSCEEKGGNKDGARKVTIKAKTSEYLDLTP